ncbi:MAG: NADH-quinone oxidoreductase subunit NuoE [Tissierellia bacterium]|nr:NADH-quinone oxidoreductase subunit NuoE [Tissierellia bacterium]
MKFNFNWEGNRNKIQKLMDFMKENRSKKGILMMALHETQDLFGYIPLEIMELISKELKTPLSEIYGVATFYSQFSLVPKGENVIGVCLGTACYVKGGQDILAKLEELLAIKEGQTTPDGKFSIDATRCLGACGLAPVMMINNKIYGKLTLDKVEEIINSYR